MPPHGKITLNEEQKDWMRKWFPLIENARIAASAGISETVMHRFARELRLTKSAKGLKGIRKRQAKKAKKINEENGWYDSMRGRKPTQACLDAYQEYLKSDRYKHPMAIMREKNPRKYKKVMQRRSDEAKDRWRKEKRRVVLGMERKYKLRVAFRPYTRREINRRHYALLHGYFLSEDHSEQGGERYIIFYDDQTQRCEKFERNCTAEGFTFKYEQS